MSPDGKSLKTEDLLHSAKNRAEAAHRAQGELIANMSHETRGPFTAILGYLEMLRSETCGALTETQREYLTYIQESTQRLLGLVNDFASLTTVDAEKKPFEPAPMSIRETFNAILSLFRQTAASRKVGLVFEVRGAEDVGVEADERKLKQALYNLVSNALKFTPAGGSVKVTAQVEKTSGELEISVRDSGIGVKEEDREKIFRSGKEEGHGRSEAFSLAVTKKLIEAHGGKIRCESESGKGSAFIFILPRLSKKKGEA